MTKREHDEIDRSLPALRELPKFEDVLQLQESVEDELTAKPQPLSISLDTIKDIIARNAARRASERSVVLQQKIADYELLHGSHKGVKHSIVCQPPAISVPNSTVRAKKGVVKQAKAEE